MRLSRRPVMVATLAMLASVAAAGRASCAGSPPPESITPQSGASYLPLAVGNRWELRSAKAPDPMVLEVTAREGASFVVRWVNPFVPVTFRLRSDGTRVSLTGLDMGQGTAAMPDNTVYWDFGLEKGGRWTSPVGTGEISDRARRCLHPAGDYADAIEVRTIDQQGKSMYWTFAPGAGLVRWGRGGDAFLLTSFRPATPTLRPPVGSGSAAPARPARPLTPGGTVLVGLDASPNETHGGGKAGKLKALQQAYAAGMTLLHSAPKWNEFEQSGGRVDLSDDATAIGEFAESHDLPIALNVRIVDTNQRSMPKAYADWTFDDPRMADRLRAALRAFPAAYKRHTRILAIGNEVDGYLSTHSREIAAYAALVRSVAPTAREEFPDAQLTVNFTFGAVGDISRYRAITELIDIASFTYYPLNADFTMRPVAELGRDIDRLLDAAGSRKLYIQEIGYASAERLNSSPQQQAAFYTAAFDLLRSHADRISGATFLFMSDLSRLVVEYLGLYYRLPNSGNFKAYIQTLGIVERDGTPKPAWDVFRREAAAMKGGR